MVCFARPPGLLLHPPPKAAPTARLDDGDKLRRKAPEAHALHTAALGAAAAAASAAVAASANAQAEKDKKEAVEADDEACDDFLGRTLTAMLRDAAIHSGGFVPQQAAGNGGNGGDGGGSGAGASAASSGGAGAAMGALGGWTSALSQLEYVSGEGGHVGRGGDDRGGNRGSEEGRRYSALGRVICGALPGLLDQVGSQRGAVHAQHSASGFV